MTTLNLSEVSKQFQVNRSTIYRAVSSGRLSRRADGSFDLAEVIRCFGEPKTAAGSKLHDYAEIEKSQLHESQDQAKIIELLQKELQQYRDREERLLNQIDRMQTLIEMKSHIVADATSQQQSNAAQSDNIDATDETLTNTTVPAAETSKATNKPLQATLQQQSIASQRNIANITKQKQQKKHGLLGRLVNAVFDTE